MIAIDPSNSVYLFRSSATGTRDTMRTRSCLASHETEHVDDVTPDTAKDTSAHQLAAPPVVASFGPGGAGVVLAFAVLDVDVTNRHLGEGGYCQLRSRVVGRTESVIS